MLDLRNLLSRSSASIQGMVERAARLNGILDRRLVDDVLAKVTSMLPSMRDVRVTLEESATQIGRVQLQNYQFEVSLTGAAGSVPTGANVYVLQIILSRLRLILVYVFSKVIPTITPGLLRPLFSQQQL